MHKLSSSTFRGRGELVADYRLGGILGKSATGIVYAARRQRGAPMLANAEVFALKCFHSEVEHAERALTLFASKASTHPSVHHPALCRLWDFETHGAPPFLAMEYLMGESLQQIANRAALNPTLSTNRRFVVMVAYAAARLCEGLATLHDVDLGDAPFVLRDIAPQRLFVLHDGSVRIKDFGLHSTAMTYAPCVHQKLSNSLPYLSPESFLKQGSDRRADIWSMGVVLWEVLTGRRLFKRSSPAATLEAIFQQDVAPPSHFNAAVPSVIDVVVMGALQRDVSRRWQDARALGDALAMAVRRCSGKVQSADLSTWLSEVCPMSGRHHQAVWAMLGCKHEDCGPTQDAVVDVLDEKTEPIFDLHRRQAARPSCS